MNAAITVLLKTANHKKGPVLLPAAFSDNINMFDMEGCEVEFREDSLRAVARKAMERKTGARGLRSIVENALLDTMYDLPSTEGVTKIVVDESVIKGESDPLVIYEGEKKRAAPE